MSVTAKVTCISKTPVEYDTSTTVVRFTPVYDADPASPNFEWSKWTPSGYIELTITNPDALDQFEVHKAYMLTFEEAGLPA